MSLARSRADADPSIVVLLGLAKGDVVALELAGARCEAAVDQDPTDSPASQAAYLLEAALRRA